MKPKASLRLFLCSTGLALAVSPSAFAQGPYYWDNTSPLSASGFGTAGGTWGTDAKWSTSSAGTAATGITSPTTSDTLNFGTSTVGLATGTIAVTGTVNSGNMTFGSASGNITFTGGTINTAAAVTINTGGNTIWYDTTVLSGATTGVTYTGGGVLRISGNNSAIAGGNFNVNQGELLITHPTGGSTGANSLGGSDGWTVQLGNTSGTSAATLSLGNSFSLPNPITVRTGSTGTKKLANNSGNISSTFSGVITVNDSLTITQDTAPTGTPGSLTVSNAGNTVALGETVTFSHLTAATLTDSSTWGGDGKLAYSGSGNGNLNVSGAKTYTGGATLGTRTGGSVIVGTDSVGPANAPTSGPFGTGTLTIGATRLLSTSADRTIANTITFAGNPAFPTNASEKSIIFSGDASLVATRTLTVDTGSTVSGKRVEFQGDISGATFGITKAGAGTLRFSGDTTYTGTTTVSAGTLQLTGNRTATIGGLIDVVGASSVLEIAGDLPMGAQQLRMGSGTGAGTVNQTAGAVTFTSGNQITVGTTATGQGFYNLSGGSITTGPQANRGVLVGTNANCTATFTLSGTGTLNVATGSSLHVCRSENIAASGTTGTFNQSGGTATIADLRVGGNTAVNNANQVATMNLTGGAFTATTFTALSGGDGSASTINISGSAVVTLPGFPSTRGAGATATVTFDGGTLKNLASSTTFMEGLSNAFIKAGGATIDTTNGDATIAQALLADGVSTGGGLTKSGANALTLAGANTYTGTTNVSTGSLKLSTAGTSVSDVVVATGAAGGASVAIAGGQHVSTGDLTLGNGSTLVIDYGSTIPGTSTAPLAVDTLSPGSGLSVRIEGAQLESLAVSQSYPLVTWTNGPVDASAFTTLVSHRSAIAGNLSVVGNTLYLTVTANTVGPITWNTGNGDWDTVSNNWADIGLASTAYVDPLDRVILGDAAGASGNPVITLNSSFSPLGVTMNSTGHDYSITGTGGIGGTTGLTLSGTNTRTLSLATANTYTGNTSVGGGTLRIDGAGTLGNGSYAGAIDISGGANLHYNSSAAQTFSGIISGAGSLTKDGGTLILSNANTYAGATAVNSGTLTISNASALGTTAGNTAVSSGARLFVGTNNLATAEALSIAGAGIDGLNGAIHIGGNATGVAFTGGITLSGDATIQADGNTGTTFSGGIDTSGNALTINGGGTTTINTVGITGTGGSLIKSGNGTLNLNADSGYTGLTTVNGGGLIVQNANALGTVAAGVVVNGTGTGSANNARLGLSGGITVTGEAATLSGVGNFTGALFSSAGSNLWAGPVTIAAAGTRLGANTDATLEVSGVIDSGVDPHGLVIRTTDLTGVVILSGANTYLGNTQVLIGKLQLAGDDNRLPVGTTLQFSSSSTNPDAELDLNGRNQEVAALELTGSGVASKNSVNNSSGTLATLTVNTPAATPSTFGGILKGNLALVKAGPDSLTLTNTANVYTGATTVSQGTLSIAAVNSANESSTVTIAPTGATLNLTFVGTDIVDKLFIGVNQQLNGVYGALGSGAQFEIPQITGTGTLTVNSGPSGGYASWASTNASGQTANLDADFDGVTNGVEYFMNAGAGFTASPQLNGSNTITWNNGGNIPASAYGTQFVVQTSNNLVDWDDVAAVDLDANTNGPGGSLTYTLDGPAPRFVRLMVTPN